MAHILILPDPHLKFSPGINVLHGVSALTYEERSDCKIKCNGSCQCIVLYCIESKCIRSEFEMWQKSHHRCNGILSDKGCKMFLVPTLEIMHVIMDSICVDVDHC